MDAIIRNAVEKDLQEMLDIYNHAILNTTAVFQYKPHTMQMRKEWFDKKKINGFPVFVAEKDGKVAGFASYDNFRQWPAYKYSIEHKIYVHLDYRRQGIAKKLLSAIIDSAKEKQMHTIIAGIDASNEYSINLHMQFGFVKIAQFKQVGYKFGGWLDLIFMQLILETPLHPHEN